MSNTTSTSTASSYNYKGKLFSKRRWEYYCFLFKWFLIGKNHCDLPQWSKKYFWVCHKTLWIVITFSICFSLYVALTYLREWIEDVYIPLW